MPERPLTIFDGDCGFCRMWVEYWRQLTGDRVDYAPSQEVGAKYPQIPKRNFERSVQLVRPDMTVASGARAVYEILAYAPGHDWQARLYRGFPMFALGSEVAYRFLASHRDLGYWLTRIFISKQPAPARFEFVEWLFVRLLALIYLTAFVSAGVQIQGLIGSLGILPAQQFLAAVQQSLGAASYWVVPTIFWLNPGDLALTAICIAGAALSIMLLIGFGQRLCLVLLYLFYLSLSSVGRDFLSFQWDALLVETGFLAIFLGRSKVVVWLFRLLLFRLMFLSGAVKLLSHDPAWAKLKALDYHYWTQPLPTPLAWYANQLPEWFQRLSAGMVFAIELGAPWLIFLPRRARFLGAAMIAGLQVMILVTGNYTFFNWLTLALCLFLLDDAALPPVWHGGRELRALPARAAWVLFAAIGSLGLFQIADAFGKLPEITQAVLRNIGQFEIVNGYGLFAVMTTTRTEIVVQGSNDGTNWRDYRFRYKPGDVRRAPPWVAPHQPRLDWQMWFAALSGWQGNPWFASFMVRLLEGSPPVVGLLESNPFPKQPPRYVRALQYHYRFTTFAERRATGDWWKREPSGTYFPAISLDALRQH